MDRLFIEGLEVWTHCGVSEEERLRGQRSRVDIELALDLRPAGMSDDLALTADYAGVARLAAEVCKREQTALIETLAERLAEAILSKFSAEEVAVRLRKLHPPTTPQVESVGVVVTRSQKSGVRSQE